MEVITPAWVTSTAGVTPLAIMFCTSSWKPLHIRWKNTCPLSPFGGAPWPISHSGNPGSSFSSSAVLFSQSPKSHSARSSTTSGWACGYRIFSVSTQDTAGLAQ